MELCEGLRVVRGPDWSWGDQDGGEGHVGTVVEVGQDGGSAVVQWDSGNRCRYRCGVEGKYDLKVFDSGPTGTRHEERCNWCQDEPLRGMLWRCARCYDYNLCMSCYMSGAHTLDHEFIRIVAHDSPNKTRLRPRYCTARVMARGIFEGAEVVRGPDWKWGNQDGRAGSPGRVQKVEGWGKETARSVVNVEWKETHVRNLYRVGHKGKVDLRCEFPGNGGYYYPDHLPVLGAPYIPCEHEELSAGDTVQVMLDPDLFRIAQEDHGGWNDRMAEFIGTDGVVTTVHDSGDIIVRYSNNKAFHLNPQTLTKVDVPVFHYGDVVRVLEDMVEVHRLQTGHGEWNDDMALSLGQVGRVIKVQANSDLRVAVNGRRWVFNPRCLSLAPGEIPLEETTDIIEVGNAVRLQLLSLVQADCPDVVCVAAEVGDVSTIITFLQKYPSEVNTMYQGKGPIHIAVVLGFIPVLRTLLQFHPDLELEDDNGEKALHLCAYVNNATAAKILLDAGADVNSKDWNGVTPLAVAAALGHHNVMELVINHPGVRIDVQDSEGKTALHSSMFSQRRRSVELLLQKGADPTLLDYEMMTPIHNAAGIGFVTGMEEIMRHCPQYINARRDNDSTPLHVAVTNHHCDVVSLLASHPSCDIDAKNRNGNLTPLHIAVHEGYIKIVERLVGYGADVNNPAERGITPLHLALGRDTMQEPSDSTPQIMKIQQELDRIGRFSMPSNVMVALFLVQQGADPHTGDERGILPFQIRSPDVATLMLTFMRSKGPSSFHGSLRSYTHSFNSSWPSTTKSQKDQLSSSGAVGVPPSGSTPQPQAQFGKQFNKSSSSGTATHLHKDLNTYAKKPPVKALSEASLRVVPCFLCQKGADTKLLPCGHVIMCSDCAGRAKRCPDCRAVVQSFVATCVLCQQEPVSHTLTPCGHNYCSNCGAQITSCLACQMLSKTEDEEAS